jgi:hypothetical protein
VIIGSCNCTLTSPFGVIGHMWLSISLDSYKWYWSNLLIPCGVEALHGVGLDKDVKSLSGEIVTFQKVSPILGR